ncbi:hypothetical protein AU476_18050 [Cupriavidus sp. UYMSc13B]|nr:hypothetical protein AU476_18050 [Cupriavidus sp. UYMSc13B]
MRAAAVWPPLLPRDLTFPDAPVHANLEASALLYPTKVAIRAGNRAWTYRDLQRDVERFAGFLRERGIGHGDRVAVWLQNCPEYVVAVYGAWRLGAVVSPLSPMLTGDEAPFFLADAGVSALVTTASLYARLADYRETPPSVLVGDDYPVPVGAVAWSEAIAAAPSPAAAVAASDIALLPYTSGTTGRPKGCVLPHSALQATIVGAAAWFRHTAASVHLATLPFFHITGFQQSMHTALATGGEMIVMERWQREEAARLLEEHRVTTWVGITAMIVDLINHLDEHPRDLSAIRFVGGGGAAIPEDVHRRVRETFGVPLVEGYGLTETASQTHLNPPDASRERCVGVPTFNTHCLILDSDLQPLPVGEVGEIAVSGPQVLREYWHRPDENSDAFVTIDGRRYFRTGDLGHVDADGYFYVVDRLKRMINAAGFKVWPAEVEARLYDHPAVSEACVVGVGDPRRGETVRALIILKPGYRDQITAAEIIDWSRERMSAYKYPREIRFVDALPRLASGKIDWRDVQVKQNMNGG